MDEKRFARSDQGRRLLPVAGIAALALLAAGTYALVGRGERSAPAAQTGARSPTASTAAATASASGPATGSTTGNAKASPTPAPTKKPVPSTAASAGKAEPRFRSGGWPNASNTGVPEGTKLRTSGPITITKPGTVIDRLYVKGCIEVLASNVTIRRTLVRGGVCGADHSIDIGYGGAKYRGILIEDVEIDGARIQARGAAIGNSGFTCRRCNIHGTARGVQMSSDVVVQDSYIHGLYGTPVSENAPIQTNGGDHFVIRHNNLVMDDMPGGTSALALFGEFGAIDDVLVERNLFNGGTYCVYAANDPTKPHPVATRARFVGNAFGRSLHRKCGLYGPVTAWSSKGRGNVWSGNYWLDTKRIIAAGG